MKLAAAGHVGTVRRFGAYWRIECEPHIRGRLRRVFAQVSQRASEVVDISDSPENARDLIWFLERYPMKVSDLKLLRARAKQCLDAEEQVQELLSRRSPPASFELAEPPREYQREAATLAMARGGLLVGDDVGLGKTVTAICPMTSALRLPALVVTLTHLTRQWEEQIKRFAPQLRTHVLRTGQPYDLAPQERRRRGMPTQSSLFTDESAPQEPDVIITNYAKLAGWAEVLAGKIRYVVFDEAQEARRSDSNKYAAAKLIASKAALRVGLSATPIYGYGSEWFNVIDLLVPGALGTREEFVREWCVDDDRVADSKAFGTYLRATGLMIRRTRKDVRRELPPCPRIPHTININRAALENVKGAAIELARVILASHEHQRGAKFFASEEFNVLMRQATGIAKAPYVAEFVRMLLASTERVVLFGWHREVYRIWMEQLKEFNPMLYTGTESALQKEAAKHAFVAGNCRVLVISLRAGSGLDGLQSVCNVGVVGELDWAPGVHEQCIGRYHRDGQTADSVAYFLLADDGSDPVIADVLGIKRGQIEGVRDPDGNLVEQLQVDRGGIKRLAAEYLRQQGVSVDSAAVVEDELMDLVPLP